MNDTEVILAHLAKIAVNLEELVSFLTPEQSAIYVDGSQQVNLIRVEDALAILDSFGKNSASGTHKCNFHSKSTLYWYSEDETAIITGIPG